MAKRMVIPVNFSNEDDYEYVKKLPNASHYIRELVRKDRLNQQNDRDYIDKKIEELKKELKNSNIYTVLDEKSDENEEKDENLKKSVQNMLNMY